MRRNLYIPLQYTNAEVYKSKFVNIPDCPFDASPVAILTLPVELDAAVLPVFKYRPPLLPVPLVAAVWISTLPLAPEA